MEDDGECVTKKLLGPERKWIDHATWVQRQVLQRCEEAQGSIKT